MPVKVLHAKNGGVLAGVVVTVRGHKYVFIVDTGAEYTQLNIRVAKALGLKKAGKAMKIGGIGSGKAQPVKISGWNIAGHPLPARTVDATKLAIAKGSTKFGGLLGSDVWSTFGSLQVNYTAKTITVG